MFAADMEHYFAAYVRAPYSVFLKCVKTTQVQMRVTVVDAISEVQCLDKPEWIKNCSHVVVKSVC